MILTSFFILIDNELLSGNAISTNKSFMLLQICVQGVDPKKDGKDLVWIFYNPVNEFLILTFILWFTSFYYFTH